MAFLRHWIPLLLCAPALFAGDEALIEDLLAGKERPVFKIRKMGPAAERVVLRVAEELKADEPSRRRAAALALARLQRLAAPAAKHLVAALDDDHRQFRFDVLRALGAIGPEAAAAIPKIRSMLASKDKHVRSIAAFTLTSLGPDVLQAREDLIRLLTDSYPGVRAHAAWALRNLGKKAAPAAAALGRLLSEKNVHVRIHAADALLALEAAAAPALEPLHKALQDSKERVRTAAVKCLGYIGKKPEAVVPSLIRILADPSWNLRVWSAWSLGQFKRHAKAALPKLRELAAKDNPAVKSAALGAIRSINPDEIDYDTYTKAWRAGQDWREKLGQRRLLDEYDGDVKRAVEDLCAKLGSEDETGRALAAHRLGDLGKDAAAAAPHLVRAIRDPDPDVRQAILWALAEIGHRDEKLGLAMLADRALAVRSAAIEFLAAHPNLARTTVARLLDIASGEDDAADSAQTALTDSKGAAAHLAALVAEAKSEERMSLVLDIWEGAESTPATVIPHLFGVLKRNVSTEILYRVVERIAAAGKAAVPSLSKALSIEKSPVQIAVLMALEGLGPDARPALPAIRRLLAHADEEVREAAQGTLAILEADDG